MSLYLGDNLVSGVTTFSVDQVYSSSSTNAQSGVAVASAIDTMLAALYPVGSVYIGTQNDCPLTTLISGSTWVKVSEGRVLQGSDSSHSAGSTIAAGLPNITGTVPDPIGGNAGTWTGAFARGSYAGSITASSVDYDGYNISFDASRSSSIYGNSSTVQPPAYVVNIWQRTA